MQIKPVRINIAGTPQMFALLYICQPNTLVKSQSASHTHKMEVGSILTVCTDFSNSCGTAKGVMLVCPSGHAPACTIHKGTIVYSQVLASGTKWENNKVSGNITWSTIASLILLLLTPTHLFFLQWIVITTILHHRETSGKVGLCEWV